MSYYKYHVFFCTNLREDGGGASCEQCKASELRNYTKARIKELGLAGAGGVRINTAGCLDRCSEGPVIVIYPQGTWYHYVDRKDVDEIIDEHLRHGRIVERLHI